MKRKEQSGVLRGVLSAALFGGLLTAAAPAASVPIAVNFDAALSSTGLPRTLPFEIDSTAQNLFLRFLVPDAARVDSINSMSVTVRLHDDAPDVQDEAAFIAIALPGPFDILLGLTVPSELQGTTAGAPLVFNTALTAAEIAEFMAFGALDNGAFRVRVARCCGDFVVLDGSVTIDANLVPEPGTVALLAAACGVLALRRRRSRL